MQTLLSSTPNLQGIAQGAAVQTSALQIAVQILEGLKNNAQDAAQTLLLSGKITALDQSTLTLQTASGPLVLLLAPTATQESSSLAVALNQLFQDKATVDLVIPKQQYLPTINPTALLFVDKKIAPPPLEPSTALPAPTLIQASPTVTPGPFSPEKIFQAILLPTPATLPTWPPITQPDAAPDKAISQMPGVRPDNTPPPLTQIPIQSTPKTVPEKMIEMAKQFLAKPLAVDAPALRPTVSVPPIAAQHAIADFYPIKNELPVLSIQFVQNDNKSTSSSSPLFQAQVIKPSSMGATLLKTPNETIYIREQTPVHNDDTVLFKIAPTPNQTELSIPIPHEERPPLLQFLNDLGLPLPSTPLSSTASAAHALKADKSLATTLLTALGCLDKGEGTAWINLEATTQDTQADKEKQAQSLSHLLRDSKSTSTDQSSNEWTNITLPFRDAFLNLTQNIHVSYRTQQHQDKVDDQNLHDAEKKARKDQTRFLVEIHPTNLGAMQIDGLSQHNQLDLILRSERVLPTSLHSEIITRYTNLLESIGHKGSIRFQTGRHLWIDIQQHDKTQGFIA